MITIKEISAPETYTIRKAVLRENIPLTEKMEGDFDSSTIHLGVYVNNELQCVATFMPHESSHFTGKQYRLRGMATSKDAQGLGLGRKVLEAAATKLRTMDIDVLWCNARVVALDFYKKCGYHIIGDEFDVHLVGPHYVMYKMLQDVE